MISLIQNSFAPDWNTIDALSIVGKPELSANKKHLICFLGNDEIQFTINRNGIRFSTQENIFKNYGLLINEPQAQELSVDYQDNQCVVTSNEFKLVLNYRPFAFKLFSNDRDNRLLIQSSNDGHFVRKHRIPPLAKFNNQWLFSLALDSNEPIYGLGEKWSSLNKRGQFIRSYNHDALGVNAEISYKNIPFAWSPRGWSVLSHTPYAVSHAVGFAPWSQRSYTIVNESNDFDIFINIADLNAKNKAENLIRLNAELTGFAPEPPEWSTGIILSKAYYQDADEILAVAHKVREQAMPCEVITFDGRAWQDTDTRFAFEWCSQRYPNPEVVIDQLKALDFKICVWEYPLISTRHSWFKEFAAKGWLLKDTRTDSAYEFEWEREAFGEVLTPLPNSGIVDFTHPDAYQFWLEQHRDLFELGVDMIKADFGEQIPDQHIQAYNGASGKELHNVYAHLYNRCVFEAAEKYSKNGAFLFSRSAWVGSQRFNSQWGGDPQADWEGMQANIRGGLSWGLSGAPFYATDIGGFYKDTRDDHLYIRWAQAALFSAHYRLHGIGDREPWSYADEASEVVMQVLRLREILRPYIFRTMQEAVQTGVPVQRAMVLAFPNQPQLWGFENQFMCGKEIFVAPCFRANHTVDFYLPEGEWQQMNIDGTVSQKIWLGNQYYKLTLALNEMACFIHKGRTLF